MKKTLLIVLACAIVLGAGGFYWWKGTPIYSLTQLKKAIDKQDTVKALSYFDTDTIFESLWTQGLSAIETQASGGRFADRIPALEQKMTSAVKPIAKQKFVEALTASLASGKPENASGSATIVGAVNEKPTIKITGDNAVISTPKGVSLVMQQQADRSWKIIDIKGVAEAVVQKYE